MENLTDTIVACSTSMHSSAIAIVRLSGSLSLSSVNDLILSSSPLSSHVMTPVKVCLGEGIIDEAMACYFASPRSYTGEDMVEVYLHGNPLIVQSFLKLCLEKDCRLAEKGEFTKRSFINGKKDLLQAESVLMMIEAPSIEALKLSSDQLSGKISLLTSDLRKEVYELLVYIEAELDFVEQDLDFLSEKSYKETLLKIESYYKNLCSHFYQMSILYQNPSFTLCGLPNVGKSSLFNCFMDQDLAIVTSIEGTTRDVLSSTLLIDQQKVILNDTAGVRSSLDEVEKEGVKRALKTVQKSDMVLYVIDTPSFVESLSYRNSVFENIFQVQSLLSEGCDFVCLFNKKDLIQEDFSSVVKLLDNDDLICFFVTSLDSASLQDVKKYFISFILNKDRVSEKGDLWFDQRSHLESMKNDFASLLKCDIMYEREVLPIHLRSLLKKIDCFLHQDFKDDVLGEIFSRFCIGK